MKKKLILVGAMLVVSSQTFAQQEKENQIEEVTIASKTPQKLHKTGKNVKLLTSEDLEKFKGQNLNEVLQQVSGVQISGNFNNNQEPKSTKIRGGKLANILILIDGVPMKDVTGNDYNAMDLRLFAIENIDSIEILNGASSVLYGSNATVSVISIKTRKSTHKKLEGAVSARGGSFGTFSQNGLVKGNINGFNYQFSGFNEKSDGLSSAEGENFEKDGFEKQNIAANFGFQNKILDININSGWNHQLYHYDYGAFTDGNQRGNDKQFYIGGNAAFNYEKGKLALNIRHSTNQRLNQDLVSENFQDQYLYKGNHFFAEIFNHYKFSEMLNITAGFQLEKQCLSFYNKPWNSDILNEVLTFDETYVYSADAFVNSNFKFGQFHLDSGARLTNHSKFKNHLVYSINPYFLEELDAVFFKIGYSYATAFIAPTLYQNFGALPYLLSNFDLAPETNKSHEIDMSFGKKDQSMVINASFFWRKEEQVFAYNMNPDFTGNFINLDENTAKGFEIGVDYLVLKQLKLGGNYSFVEKENAATMIRQPKHRINSYIEFSPYSTTRFTLSHQFTGKRDDVFWDNNFVKNELVLEAFHLLNLNVNQKIGKHFELFANIGNVLNTSYTDIVGFTSKPRNYMFGFGYKF